MVDVATVVLTIIFSVFVVGPLIAVGVLAGQPGAGSLRPQDYNLAASVVGTILGTWAGLFWCLEISNAGDVRFSTLFVVFVALALLGCLAGSQGERMIHRRRVVKYRPAPLELPQPAAGEV